MSTKGKDFIHFHNNSPVAKFYVCRGNKNIEGTSRLNGFDKRQFFQQIQLAPDFPSYFTVFLVD